MRRRTLAVVALPLLAVGTPVAGQLRERGHLQAAGRVEEIANVVRSNRRGPARLTAT